MHGRNLPWPGMDAGGVPEDSNAGDKPSVHGGGGVPGTGSVGQGGGAGGGVAGIGGDKYVYEMVAMVKNVDFLVLRAR